MWLVSACLLFTQILVLSSSATLFLPEHPVEVHSGRDFVAGTGFSREDSCVSPEHCPVEEE